MCRCMFNKVTFWRVWDPLTDEKFLTSVYDVKKYGNETAVAKAKEKSKKEKNPATAKLTTTDELLCKSKSKGFQLKASIC